MSVAEALRLAQQSGVRIAVSGQDLILEAEREPSVNVLAVLKRHKVEIMAVLDSGGDALTADEWWALFDYRAGFAEYDCGQSRDKAEAHAFDYCVAEWLIRHPACSDPGGCAECGEPENSGHAVVPFGTEHHGHTWLHPECWQAWHERRKAEAIEALSNMGLGRPPEISSVSANQNEDELRA